MTVPSASEDANSSDDVYSSVPDTSSEHIEALDERGFHHNRNDILGPLPALPTILSKQILGNAKYLNHKPGTDNDENNNGTNNGGRYNIRQGKEAYEVAGLLRILVCFL